MKLSSGKRQAQPRVSTPRRLGEKNIPVGINLNREQPGHAQKTEMTEMPKQHNENLVFTYKQKGNILNFHFINDKRVKCPTCRNEFKNILRHLQKSRCQIENIDDLSEKLKQFKEIHLAQKKKDDQKKWKAKSIAKQREDNFQQVKDDQNERKAKSIAKQREDNVLLVKEDQTKRKVNSRLIQREIDNQKILDDQKKWKSKSRFNQRQVDNEKVMADQNKHKAKSIAKQRENNDQQVKEDQNRRKRLSRNKRKWKTPKAFPNMKLTPTRKR